MTKDEALKLALKSLQKADKINGHPNNQKIIVAIKEALAEPEQESDDLTIAYMAGFYDGKNKDAPQPKPEQEPVTLKVNGIPPFKNPPNDVIDAAFHVSDWARSNHWVKWRIGDCCSVDFTTPPKREWVGLTEEEIADIANLCRWSNTYHADFVHATEAKLREENG